MNRSLNFVQVRTPSALKILGEELNEVCLVQEHTKISSKAIYRNGCDSSTMEMILLDTLIIKHIADLYEVRNA